MENFDFSFSIQCSKKGVIRGLRDYYWYIHAPRIIFQLIFALFTLILGLTQIEGIDFIYLGFSGIILFFALFEFPLFVKRVLNIIKPTGVFENETYFHFFENKFLNRCGENETTIPYNAFTGYFRFRNSLFLLMGNQLFSSAFEKTLFKDRFDDFISCIDRAGVKPVKFLTFKRWWVTFAVFAACVLYVLFTRLILF